MNYKTLQRFLDKVDKTDHQRCKDHGCWMWTGGTTGNGYGKFKLNGKSLNAHRFSYEHFKGAISKGMVVRHRCAYEHGDNDNRRCVNPDHLEVGTQKENLAEGYNKNSVKTHCPKCGGDYTTKKRGDRYCRPCYLDYQREYRHKRKAAI